MRPERRGNRRSRLAILAAMAVVAVLVVPASAAAAPPSNATPPSISGTTTQGQTLTASTGTWTGSPTSFAYQWSRCNPGCSAIPGATGSTYLLVAADVGSRMQVAVTATNGDGSSPPASSSQTAVVQAQPAPVNVDKPTISGRAQAGQTLTATQGTWQNAPTSFFYQWLRCNDQGGSCDPIPGAAQPAYQLVGRDVGSRIRVSVTAANAGGASPAAQSKATGTVKVAAPDNLTRPSISGTPSQGETLTAAVGTWSNVPTSFAYQWLRCNGAGRSCGAIPGATAATYVLGATDVGSRIRVTVRASNAGGSSKRVRSAPTARVTGPPAPATFRLKSLVRNLKTGTARLLVKVTGPGNLKLARTAKVKGDRRRVDSARTVKLFVKARGRAKQRLRRTGKVRVRLTVKFNPDVGPRKTKHRRIRLRTR